MDLIQSKRKFIVRKIALSIVALAMLAGCSDQSAQQEANQVKLLDDALALIHQAEQGYVPKQGADRFDPPEDQFRKIELQAYRQNKLSQAIGRLQPLTKGESNLQWITVLANRLLADAHTASARDMSRDAMADWSALANRCVTLLSYAGSINQAQSRLILCGDESHLVDAMNDDLKKTRHQLDDQRSAADRKKEQIDQLNQSIVDLDVKRDQTVAEARQLTEQAYLVQGHEKQDLENQAAETEMVAYKYGSQAQQIVVHRDRYDLELMMLEEEIRLTEELDASISQQIDKATKRQQNSQRLADAARQDQNEVAKLLDEEFGQIKTTYRQTVEQPLASAAEAVGSAITALEAAEGKVRGKDKEDIQHELLAKQVAKIHILSDDFISSGSFGRTIGLLAVSASSSRNLDVTSYDSEYAKLVTRQSHLASEAANLAKEANQLAESLADPGTDPFVDHHREYLAQYKNEIGAHRLLESWR